MALPFRGDIYIYIYMCMFIHIHKYNPFTQICIDMYICIYKQVDLKMGGLLGSPEADLLRLHRVGRGLGLAGIPGLGASLDSGSGFPEIPVLLDSGLCISIYIYIYVSLSLSLSLKSY